MGRNRQNFHYNFRAPDEEWFKIWLEFKEKTRTSGLDICFVALTFLFVAELDVYVAIYEVSEKKIPELKSKG